MTETDRQIDYQVPIGKRGPKAKSPQPYKPEYAEIASRLAAVGFTESDIAHTLDVSIVEVRRWKRNIPEFKTACKDGKRDQLRRMMAKALLEAVGYDYTTTKKETTYNEDGTVKSIKVTEATNHQSPQPNMLLFLACNLSSQLELDDAEKWCSRQKMELETKTINMTITGELVGEQITKLAGKLLGEPQAKQVESKATTAIPGIIGAVTGTTEAPNVAIEVEFEK